MMPILRLEWSPPIIDNAVKYAAGRRWIDVRRAMTARF
jgi:hypothetical protein